MTGIRLLPLLLAATASAYAPPHADDLALPSDLALVPRDAPAFVSLRVADLAASAAGKEFLDRLRKEKEGVGDPLADLKAELVVPPADVERLTFLPSAQVLIVRTARPYYRDKILDALGGQAQVRRHKGKTIYIGAGGRALVPIDDNVFLRGTADRLEKLLDAAAAPGGDAALEEALRLAAGKHHVTAGAIPLALLREQMRPEDGAAPPPAGGRTGPSPCGDSPPAAAGAGRGDAEELLRSLPPEALPFKPLLLARYVALTLDMDDKLKLEARAAYSDKDLAADGETSAKAALYVMRELLPEAGAELGADPESAKELRPLLRQLQEAVKGAAVRTDGTTVTVSTEAKIDPVVFALLAPQAQRIQESAESARAANNMKQIALAMINFSDANGFMPPPAVCGKDGKPLLSWRVAILPYIEQQDLYKQFKLDEPWDSEHNKKLLAQMPKVYAPLRGKPGQPNSTYCQVFVGPGAPFQITPVNGPFGAAGPRYPASFADGTANTLLVVEAGEAVPWTKPDDVPFDEKKAVPPLGGDFGVGFHAALADGSVLFIRKDIEEKLLKRLIMPADGNPINWDDVPMIGGRGGRPGEKPAAPEKGPTAPVRPPPAEKPAGGQARPAAH